MSVVDKDMGWSALARAMKSLAGDPHVLIGIQGPQASAAHNDTGLTVVEVASYNEFGADGVPERSFIRETIDVREARLMKLATALGTGVLDRRFTAGQALELLGEHTRGEMIERINSRSIPPPNAPATIARKGSSTPLVDSGQLKNSISYKVGL